MRTGLVITPFIFHEQLQTEVANCRFDYRLASGGPWGQGELPLYLKHANFPPGKLYYLQNISFYD